MPLEPIDRPELAPISTYSRNKRAALRIIATLMVVLTLAGCANGTANDAQRGRESDATRESVVTELQATQTWNLVNGTPESTPTPED